MSLGSSQNKADLSKLMTMPSGDVISILNGFSIKELVDIFNAYPEIYQRYGPLYYNAIVESRSVNVGRSAQAAGLDKLKISQKIISQESSQWMSADNLLSINRVGIVDEKVSGVMGSDLLRVDKNVVMTLSMLIDWWMTYIILNNLIVDESFKIDQKIRDGFSSIFQEKGLSTLNDVLISTFIEILSDVFNENEVVLTSEIKNYLFGQAKSLREMIDRLFQKSSSTLSIRSPESNGVNT